MGEAKVRLFVEDRLGEEQPVSLSREQAHYLFGVMRMSVGASVLLFNGKDGEWLADVAEAGKRGGTLLCRSQTVPQGAPPDLWLIFAPIKKARTDFIVEKAVELGAARILPVQTDFTNSERVRRDRLQSHATEAAEQCAITYVPEVGDLMKLGRLLQTWPQDRLLYFCDEALAGEGGSSFSQHSDAQGIGTKAAILIGPEGGFSEAERARLAELDFTRPISLGPRILRADTAAVSALTLWQAAFGDW